MLGHEVNTGKIMTTTKFPTYSVPVCLNNKAQESPQAKKYKKKTWKKLVA